VDRSGPGATGGPTSSRDESRHDAVDPRSSDQGPSVAAGKSPELPSRRPLAERIDEEAEEVEGAATSASLSSYVTYSTAGGWSQTSPKIYVLFWGNWTTGGDPYGVANYLTRFYQGVGGSSWNNTQTQYGYNCGAGALGCSNGVRIQNPVGQYRGYAYDTSAVPLHPTLAQMEAEAQKAANYWGDRSVNAQYIIALPTGHRDQRSIDQGFCAWHNYTWSNNSPISFTAMPYLVDQVPNCGRNQVNAGTAGLLDGVSILAGHEYVESVTDPFMNAWTDTDRNETSDKCLQWTLPGYFRNTTFTSGTFAVQPNWSNYAYQTTGNGCMFWS
jgi:serine protease